MTFRIALHRIPSLALALVAMLLAPASAVAQTDPAPEFRRGDADGNGFVEPLYDAYYLVWSAFASGPPPPCMEATDADGDGVAFALLDAIYLLSWGFGTGTPPTDPGPFVCGTDPESETLGCENPPDCAGGPTRTLPEDLDHTLRIESASGVVGSTATVVVSLDVGSDSFGSVEGFRWSVCHDAGVSIDVEGIALGATLDGDLDTLATMLAATDDGWTAGILLNVLTGTVLEEGTDYELATAEYELLAEGTTTLEFCSLGSVDDDEFPVGPAVIADFSLVTPELEDGTIEIQLPIFKRGDVDGNGQVFSILDALYLLDWGFTLGPPPFCFDAADADDNGEVFPIIDAITILHWGFTAGPPPPEPGAFECGVDPTEDELPCETVSGCD